MKNKKHKDVVRKSTSVGLGTSTKSLLGTTKPIKRKTSRRTSGMGSTTTTLAWNYPPEKSLLDKFLDWLF